MKQNPFLLHRHYILGNTFPIQFHYVILVEVVFPPRPDVYEKVRGNIAKSIFNGKIEKSIEEWSAKLREAYELRIFVQEFDG